MTVRASLVSRQLLYARRCSRTMRRVALAGWLMVELQGSAGSEPKVFRTIKGWMISSDSVRFAIQLLLHPGANSFPQGDLIVAMTGEEPGALTKTIQKLRFDRAQPGDYWVFQHKIATARLQECLAQQ